MTYEEALQDIANRVLSTESSLPLKDYFRLCAPDIFKYVEDFALLAEANGTSAVSTAIAAATFVYASINIAPELCGNSQK